MDQEWEAPQASDPSTQEYEAPQAAPAPAAASQEWEAPQAKEAAPTRSAPIQPTHMWEAPQITSKPEDSPFVQNYLQLHPATSFSLNASPAGMAQQAKAGTVGIEEDVSDKQREANTMKDSALGFFNARIRQFFLDPQFTQMSKEEQDHIINDQVQKWTNEGIQAGKLNAANPDIWKGVNGKNSLADAMAQYVNDIRDPSKGGLAGAAEPIGVFHGNKAVVQQDPGMLESAGIGALSALPSTSGALLGGELGGLGGGAIAPEFGGGIIGGIGGSLAGAYLGEAGIRDYIQNHGTEAQRDELEAFDNLHGIAQEGHPIASIVGSIAAQAPLMGTGLAENGLAKTLAPRLGGAALGAGIETGNELAQDQPLNPYQIGAMGASGAIFVKPRFMGEGIGPMDFKGRAWQDTNGPRPELMNAVEAHLRAGNNPDSVFSTFGQDLPDNLQNRRAVRAVSADIRAGRDPDASLSLVNFRPAGLSVDDTVSAASAHTQNWKDAPPVLVHDSFDSPSIPDNMKDKVGPGTLGWKDEDGTIHLVASQHADSNSVTATMFHEGMHVGLVRAYQEGLQDQLVKIYDGANTNLKLSLDAMEERQAQTHPNWDSMDANQRKALVTDEVLAHANENGLPSSALDRVSAYIRAFGRGNLGEFGKSLKYSDAEVRQIMQTGYDAVSKGDSNASLGPIRNMNSGAKPPSFSSGDNDNPNLYGFEPHRQVKASDTDIDTRAPEGPYHGDNNNNLPLQDLQRQTRTIENPEGGGRRKTLPNPDDVFGADLGRGETLERIDDLGKTDVQHVQTYTNDEARRVISDRMGIPLEDLRFSRKYSGDFPEGYSGRQDRTEDYIRNRFSPALANELKGKLKPLGEYQPVSDEQMARDVARLKEDGFDAGLAIAQGAIPDNTAFIHALTDTLYEHLSDSKVLSRKYMDSNDERDGRAFLAKAMKTGELFSVLDKSASNLGRMFRALGTRINEVPDAGLMRMLDSIRFSDGSLGQEGLKELAAAFATKNDPVELRKTMDKFDPKWKEYGHSLFYNFILGSKSVQIAKVIGHATMIGREFVNDLGTYGVGAGKALSGLKDANGRMYFDEITNKYSAILGGLLNQKTYDGARAWNNGVKQFLAPAGTSVIGNPLAHQAIPNRVLSVPLEYGTRGLQATDAFFRTVLEHAAMQHLSTIEARRLNAGATPSTDQIAAVMASPTRDMLSQVRTQANRMLFLEEPADQVKWATKLVRSIPGGFMVSPIMRTPGNIGRTAAETFLSPGITQRGREAFKTGGAARDRVIAQQLIAGALWMGAAYLIKNGTVTGGGPQDLHARSEWAMSNHPYSLRTGPGPNDFMPLRDFAPYGTGLATIADLNQAVQDGIRRPNQDASDTTMQIAGGMMQGVLQNSYLANTADMFKDPKQAVVNLIGTAIQAGSNIPIYSEIDKERDPWKRDLSKSEGFLPNLADQAASRDNPAVTHYIPSVVSRGELPVARNVFGEPISAADPTSKDPIAREIGRLAGATGMAPVPEINRRPKGQRIPNAMYDNFLAWSGPIMREATSQAMKTPEYLSALTDQQRVRIIQRAFLQSGPGEPNLHERLNKQLEQTVLDSNPDFVNRFIPQWKQDLSTLPTSPRK